MPKKNKRKSGVLNFQFNRSDTIGNASAEQDDKFLCDCFVDTGFLSDILDVNSSRCVIIGRTGAGKSALLKHINETKDENVICIDPQNIAIQFLSTTTVIRWLVLQNVNMNHVFKLLWRHIIAVEIFHHINSKHGWNSWKEWIKRMLGIDHKRRSLLQQSENYVNKYGNVFWDSTESRVKSIIETLSSRVQEAIGVRIGIDPFAISGNESIDTDKIKTIAQEVVTNFSTVVSQGQIGELKILETVVEGLLDKHYEHDPIYITIDQLDEDWVDESVKYLLLRTLVDTAQELNIKRKGGKIILGLRLDLLERLFQLTHESGQQREKYEDLFLYLRWDIDGLSNLANLRIQKLVSDRYTGEPISLIDVLPESILSARVQSKNKIKPLQYLWDQTWFRPRDVIMFVNNCLELASGHSKITKEIVKQAAKKYSKSRYNSLIDEWKPTYPEIDKLLSFLRNCKSEFHASEITYEKLSDLALEIASNETNAFYKMAYTFLEDQQQSIQQEEHLPYFERKVFFILYEIGVIGIKTGPQTTTLWKHIEDHGIVGEEIQKISKIVIHQALWNELNISSLFDLER